MMSNTQKNTEPKSLPEETNSLLEEAAPLRDETRDWYHLNHDAYFSLCLLSTVVMIIWPWIIFGVVQGSGGIQLQPNTRIAEKYSQEISFFVTSVAGVINAIITYLFSSAVANLAKKQVIHRNMTISRIIFFIALRTRALPSSLFQRRRCRLFLPVILYIILFTFITPGITVLLLPIDFTRSTPLDGIELDFGSNDTDCVNWFNDNIIPDTLACNWKVSLDHLVPNLPAELPLFLSMK